MEYIRQSHSVYYTRYHLVISTKYRRKVLNEGISAYLKLKTLEVMKYHPELKILQVNTDLDHMHLLMSVPPKMAVSHAVNLIKTNTGRALRLKFPFLDKVYWGSEGVWSVGYFVSTVGINEETIRRYIEWQGREDRGQAKLEL